MLHPLQLTADRTTWYAIESTLKLALQQPALGEDATFVHSLFTRLGQAITAAEEGDGSAQIT